MLLRQARTKTNPPKKREETRETSQEEGELQELKRARQRQNEKFEINQAFALAKRINKNGPKPSDICAKFKLVCFAGLPN